MADDLPVVPPEEDEAHRLRASFEESLNVALFGSLVAPTLDDMREAARNTLRITEITGERDDEAVEAIWDPVARAKRNAAPSGQ